MGRIALAWTVLSALAVLLTIDGPGLTIDEPLDVAPGRKYVQTLLAKGTGFFAPEVVRTVHADNAEHPPLGRWLLGIASIVGQPIELIVRGKDPVGLYVRAGRAAPAFCFAALVGLVALTAGRHFGRVAAVAAGFSLLVMPRMFAHAHLGALDTFVALFWTLALLTMAHACERSRPVRSLALAGVWGGLALLTKIHGWLLGPVVAVWTWYRLGLRRALAGSLVWGLVAVGLWFVGWPWLWYDTATRLPGYFRTGVERLPIQVQYFGRVLRDTDVPWHYPWVYFAVTIPVGLLAFGLWGATVAIRERRTEPLGLLLVGVILGWLCLFSTSVAVYDGERLFAPAFPLAAILVGRGFADAWQRASKRGRGPARIALGGLLLAQAYGVIALHPFGLSYYNALVRGLPGAERLGLELTYWGDAADRTLLDDLARRARPNDSAALAPTLAPDQGKVATTGTLARLPVVLADEDAAGSAEWIVVTRRTAYWRPEVRALVEEATPVAVRTRQGVWLSGLWHRPPAPKPFGIEKPGSSN